MNETKQMKSATSHITHPTLFVDNLHISIRTDGMCLLRYSVNLPDEIQEQFCCMTTPQAMRNMGIKMIEASDSYEQEIKRKPEQ